MTIECQFDEENHCLTIVVDGDFDVAVAKEFVQLYESSDKNISCYCLDMSHVNYLDSSALGVLLEFKTFAKAREADIFIRNMNDVVLEIFRVLNFHKLFKPEYNRDNLRVDWVAHASDPES